MADNTEKVTIKDASPVNEKKEAVLTHNHKVSMALWVVAGAVILLVVFGGTFALVRDLKSRTAVNQGGFRTEMMGSRGMMRGGGRGFGFGQGSGLRDNEIPGKVASVTDKQFTVTVGSTTKTVQISDTTRFPVNSATKVAVGDQVIVTGEQDSNGVIQALRIVVNPSSLN